MNKGMSSKAIEFISLAFLWSVEISAFILLPLIVYFISYKAFPIEGDDLKTLPEWMFMAVILYGDYVRKLLQFYRGYEGYSVKSLYVLSLGIIGMVSSSVMIAYSLISTRVADMQPSADFYVIQNMLFVSAVLLHFVAYLSLAYRQGHGRYLALLVPEKPPKAEKEST